MRKWAAPSSLTAKFGNSCGSACIFHAIDVQAMREEKALVKKRIVQIMFVAGVVGAFTAGGVRADDTAEKTYKAKCAGCHGADGKGNTEAGKALGAHDFSSPDVQKESDADLSQIITAGKNKIPPYGKSLSPAEIKDLVAYNRGFAKK